MNHIIWNNKMSIINFLEDVPHRLFHSGNKLTVKFHSTPKIQLKVLIYYTQYLSLFSLIFIGGISHTWQFYTFIVSHLENFMREFKTSLFINYYRHISENYSFFLYMGKSTKHFLFFFFEYIYVVFIY